MVRERLLENITKIHTTELGVERIKRNLKLDSEDVLDYCIKKIKDDGSVVSKKGKNYYVENENIIITVNSYSFTIITAHIKKEGMNMSFDYKKEYKEYYMPKNKPTIVTIPKMNYLAVRGKGDPNIEGGEYKKSIELLYAIAFTIKMSYKTNYKIDGYFSYVVPPLEGFWWQDGIDGVDYTHKENFNFISVIRLPDFVTKEDFEWAIQEATKKKKQDFSMVEFLTYDEGLCVQCMHNGSYDDEPTTINLMHKFVEDNGYELDITDARFHHEIYLSDPRRCDVSKLKTVIRHPIKKID